MYTYQKQVQLPTQIFDAVWSPNGELLALAGVNGGVFIVTKDYRYVSSLQGYIGKANALAWSSDSLQIVCADAIETNKHIYMDVVQTIRIWDAITGKSIKAIYSHRDIGAKWVRWSSDSKLIFALLFNNIMMIWDVYTGNIIQQYQYEMVDYHIQWFEETQRLFAIGYDAKIRLWQRDNLTHTIPFYADYLMKYVVDYHPKYNQVVFPIAPRKIVIWNLDKHEKHLQIDLPFAPEFIYWHPNGLYLVTMLRDSAIYFWDAQTGKRINIAKSDLHYPNTIRDLQYSPTGDYLAGISHIGSIYVWRGYDGKLIDKIEGLDSGLKGSLQWSPNENYLIAITNQLTPILWRFDNQLQPVFKDISDFHEDVSVFDKHQRHPNADEDKIAFVEVVYLYNDDGDMIENSSIVVQSVQDGHILYRLNHHKMPISALAWHPTDNLLASGGFDHNVVIWDIKIGEIITYLWTTSSIMRIEWFADGDVLQVTCVDGSVIVWEKLKE